LAWRRLLFHSTWQRSPNSWAELDGGDDLVVLKLRGREARHLQLPPPQSCSTAAMSRCSPSISLGVNRCSPRLSLIGRSIPAAPLDLADGPIEIGRALTYGPGHGHVFDEFRRILGRKSGCDCCPARTEPHAEAEQELLFPSTQNDGNGDCDGQI
jgi:hypothetical protein